MPRTLTLRKALAAMTMAVAALCGGGKVASAEQKGTLSIVEVRSNAALRPDQRKRAADYLRTWLRASGHPDAVVTRTKAGPLSVWTSAPHGDVLERGLPKAASFGIHTVARDTAEKDIKTGEVEPGLAMLEHADSGEILVLTTAPNIGADGIESATVGFSSYDNRPVVNFKFTETAAKEFADLTTNSVGERLAIVVDEKVVSAPVVREPILGGAGQISGNFTVEEAQALALRMTPPPDGITFVVLQTCLSGIPRAPPSWAPKWIVPEPACERSAAGRP